MKDILEEIVAHKRMELAEQKSVMPYSMLLSQAGKVMDSSPVKQRSMAESISKSASGIIAEFKRHSPSKGWIKENGKPDRIAPSYEKHGASAISILTDFTYFGGTIHDIVEARPMVHIPILRKDFIIDEYQLLQAKIIGADAVLLIAADLTMEECRSLAACAHDLQLETLLEVHSESELDYVGDHIDMVGVNNRHLGTFQTDVENSFRLAAQLPSDYVLVSESGISAPQTIRQLRQAGFSGFLIGERFMKTEDPGSTLGLFVDAVVNG
ncbi:MAG: indole-3-glycerol phosphate synthase TrpC [Bacteroidaceae bacterium]|nr:indole-3-glycerol phosphate synthase TrpC [Bacteroidaceae bacterium]